MVFFFFFFFIKQHKRGVLFFFFQAEDGIRAADVTGVQTCALPICAWACPGCPGDPQGKQLSARGSGCTLSRTRWTTSATGTKVRLNDLTFHHRACQTSRGRFFSPSSPPHHSRQKLGNRIARTDTSKTGTWRSSGCSRMPFWPRLLTTAARDIGCSPPRGPIS